jgi:hypothetical protein
MSTVDLSVPIGDNREDYQGDGQGAAKNRQIAQEEENGAQSPASEEDGQPQPGIAPTPPLKLDQALLETSDLPLQGPDSYFSLHKVLIVMSSCQQKKTRPAAEGRNKYPSAVDRRNY